MSENINPVNQNENQLVDDLKKSLNAAIEEASLLLKNSILKIESTVEDEKLEKNSTKKINNLYTELTKILDETNTKLLLKSEEHILNFEEKTFLEEE
jgi:hypothetical protein|tara:strand:+ start:4397 stop:4687 length:291 start_codon:yes stop_codon:yes gene_type:complete